MDAEFLKTLTPRELFLMLRAMKDAGDDERDIRLVVDQLKLRRDGLIGQKTTD